MKFYRIIYEISTIINGYHDDNEGRRMLLFMAEDEYQYINEEYLNTLKEEIVKESEEHYSKSCESFKVSSVRILSIQRISKDDYKNKVWEYEKF